MVYSRVRPLPIFTLLLATLLLAGPSTAGADFYNVYRGDLSAMIAGVPARCHGFEVESTTFDGVDTEGSWGQDSLGNQRSTFGVNGASGRCGMTDKDLSNSCGAD